MLAVTLDSPKTSEGGSGPAVFVLTKSLTSAYTSPIIFAVIRLNFPVFATPGAARRADIFGRCSMFNTFNNWVNWETSCDELFGSHGSSGTFSSSHLTNKYTCEAIRTIFENNVHGTEIPSQRCDNQELKERNKIVP
jgi:hypothetical protein